MVALAYLGDAGFNLVLIPIGKCFLAMPIELKTQDRRGRAVGALHGKQESKRQRQKTGQL